MAPSIYPTSLLAFLITLLLYTQLAADPVGPMETVRDANDAVLAIYHRSDIIDTAVQQRVFKIMKEVTDFAVMADNATAPFCAGDEPELCHRFQSLFVELLQYNGIRKLGRYRADRFQYGAVRIDGDEALVQSKAYYQDQMVHLDYILQFSDGRWRIVNYITDDIDTIRNYQRQFRRIIAKSSLPALLEILQRKVDEYRQSVPLP